MEKVAFMNGGTFIYWSSIIMTLAVAAAVLFFVAVYLGKQGSGTALAIAIPVAMFSSLLLARLIHWYCRTDAYESLQAAMTDYTWGGYALMGVFAGCFLTAVLLRIFRVSRNLPQMLDAMAIAGGIGIAVGRLASLFNSSARGIIVPDSWGMPFAYPVTNAVSGVVENRLATFMLQSITTAAIVAILLVVMLGYKIARKKLPDGDVCLLFLLMYGGCQIVLDSTRYDSLFMRSNGFISIVQILGLVFMLAAVVLFSIRMVRTRGLKIWQFLLWLGFAGSMGAAAYMEYHVQRHGDQAALAYSVMSAGILVAIILTVIIRSISMRAGKVPVAVETEEESE